MTSRRTALLAALASLGGSACALARSGTRRDELAQLRSTAPLDVRPAPATPPRVLPPVRFPDDEGPHDVLAEWWYYTGHLFLENDGSRDADGPAQYGFELVFFRGVRGDRPPGYAAHFAVTDIGRRRFTYDQRQDIALREAASPRGPVVDGDVERPRPPGLVALVPAGGGFDLAMGDWWLRGAHGRDRLRARMPGGTYAIDLSLHALKPPALHLGVPPLEPGLISFGPAGYSYYYSRTRMETTGTLLVDGATHRVRGTSWMDHQWGDFLVLAGGGWDWFAVTLDDGREVTISVIRDAGAARTVAYGTLVDAGGTSHHLPPEAFRLDSLETWRSDRTGIRYPSKWRLDVPGAGLHLALEPVMSDQELDTRPSTGVIYWEGVVSVLDAQAGGDVGRGFVELTGYT